MRASLRIAKLALGVLFLLSPRALGVEQTAIRQAVERGVAHLKSLQQADGSWPFPPSPAYPPGMTALAAFALMECEVSPHDPVLEKALPRIRQTSLRLTDTYSVSVAVLCLDRTGEAGDEPLIAALVLRLLGGQTPDGGWGYACPPLPGAVARELRQYLSQRRPSVPGPGGERSGEGGENENLGAAALTRRLRRLGSEVRVGSVMPEGDWDNSNTQFATLALWVARRHGMPVDRALAAIGQHFRTTQHANGTWEYVKAQHSFPFPESNTCAGLLGLAVAHGISDRQQPGGRGPPGVQARRLARDPSVVAGMVALSRFVGTPVGTGGGRIPILPYGEHNPQVVNNTYYYLWSLERVAVAYDFQTIAGKDWYEWGAELLLANQAAHGGWYGTWQDGPADTCFALLFLRRSNRTPDLAAILKGQGPPLANAGGKGPALEAVQPHGVEPPHSGERQPEAGYSHRSPEPAAKEEQGESRAPQSAPQPLRVETRPGLSRAAGSEGLAPRDDLQVRAGQLTDELLSAPAERQAPLIADYQQGKGVAYTQALAEAIPRLPEPAREQAREALARRFARMTEATLRARLHDDDPEVRAAVALACAMRDEKALVPDLIGLIPDREARVARAAGVTLKALSGQDFGPALDSSPPERAAAAARWRAWWEHRPPR